MDYNNDNSERWDWHRNPHVQKDSTPDISECLWNGVPQNQEDLSYMLDDETTPVKACGDLAYEVNQRDNRNKEPEEQRESFSQVKRRRMLQFDTEAMDSSLSSEDLSSAFLKSNEGIDSIEGFEATNWVSGFSENASASGYECLDESPDRWIEQCFTDPADMQFSPDDIDFSGASDVHIDITKLCDIQPEYHHANVNQQRVTRSPRNIIFRGRKSYIRAPTKLATSVAYPFAFIKPSGTHGAVTLKDINQRIRTPPPSKAKQKEPEQYPTSAFSGKPVVGKTKIRTEGGKGSITIMRTKG
ncbi:PREDICTED: protein XRI1 [Fragaria vesca subsp. vesca]|uniref:protein XRI1 n=1 Tax=Fragaria vesca subsp. vesca TaxID=101020 RepID=UPI0002C3175C|nr:PREDICTED: protein XRI1 [Fragaria vesca subsp. vesca]